MDGKGRGRRKIKNAFSLTITGRKTDSVEPFCLDVHQIQKLRGRTLIVGVVSPALESAAEWLVSLGKVAGGRTDELARCQSSCLRGGLNWLMVRLACVAVVCAAQPSSSRAQHSPHPVVRSGPNGSFRFAERADRPVACARSGLGTFSRHPGMNERGSNGFQACPHTTRTKKTVSGCPETVV